MLVKGTARGKWDTYTSQGITIHYLTLGTGKPLLFLQGLGVSPAAYLPLLVKLSRHYTVIAPEIPGFGRSTAPPANWDFASYADFFYSFMDTLHEKSYIVVAHSFGGGIAEQLASRHSGVSRIVLFNAPIESLPMYSHVWRYIWTALGMVLFQKTATVRAVVAFTDSVFHHLGSLPRMIQVIERSFATNAIHAPIRVPTLFIWAKNDELLPALQAETVKKWFPEGKIEYVRGHHNWCFFSPESVAKRVLEFTR